MIAAQGGDPRVVDDHDRSARGGRPARRLSRRRSACARIDAEEIGLAAMALGAGRDCADASIDPAVGIVLERKIGDAVRRGELLATIDENDATRGETAAARVQGA